MNIPLLAYTRESLWGRFANSLHNLSTLQHVVLHKERDHVSLFHVHAPPSSASSVTNYRRITKLIPKEISSSNKFAKQTIRFASTTLHPSIWVVLRFKNLCMFGIWYDFNHFNFYHNKTPEIDTYKFIIFWSHDLYAFPIKRESSIHMSWSWSGHGLVPSLSLVECLFSNMAFPVNIQYSREQVEERFKKPKWILSTLPNENKIG